jgi:bifunctional DNA-binding transcriptional regulator/antitoxin component of YhaV-PrlF toxin-antitoxin module
MKPTVSVSKGMRIKIPGEAVLALGISEGDRLAYELRASELAFTKTGADAPPFRGRRK